MTPTEFEEQLNDLDTRVDRLRALYENWFRGYEKTEPRVARKDVERRVYGMRKELPRNTALRFRYHQLYQRYTTLTQYWSRTARQIEEGTYRLQHMRLRRKKEREEERAVRRQQPVGPESDAPEGDSDQPRPGEYELDLNESLNVGDLLDEVELAAVARAVDGSIPPPEPVKATFAKPKRQSVSPAAKAEPVARAKPAAQREAFFDDEFDQPTGLHLDIEEGEPMRAAPRPSPLNGARASLPNGQPVPPPAAGLPRSMPGAPVPPPAPGLPRATVAGGGPPPAPGLPRAPAPSTPRATPAAAPPPVPPAARGSLPDGARPPVPPRPPSPFASAPGQPIRPAPVAAVGAPQPGGAPAAPGGVERRPPIQSVNTLVGRPAPTSPIAGPEPKTGTHNALPDQRLRRLYDEYSAARRRNNEGDVRYESLVNSIQKMLPDLQKKHAGKQIDFEVVVKDGRVGLKPKPTDAK